MRKFVKILFSIVFCFLIVFSFVACGAKSEEIETKNIVKDKTSNLTLTLIEPTSDITSFFNVFTTRRYNLGIIDESNDNFYKFLLYGQNYKDGQVVPASAYNWNNVEDTTYYSYFELSGMRSTFFKSGTVYSLAMPEVDFSSFTSDSSSFEGSMNDARNVYRKLNWPYVLVNDNEYNSCYKLIGRQEAVATVECVSSNDIIDLEFETKVNGSYTFLTKPMPLMSSGLINTYDFEYVKTGDVYLRVYVDSSYGVTLGVDQILTENINGNDVTLYRPLYRTFFYIYDIV